MYTAIIYAPLLMSAKTKIQFQFIDLLFHNK